ncbi:acetylornithine deacetylase [Dictyobacter aurantiacus]|uniref:Acetylornithine deacetylase n=1 Tax=Dictyobacter aurantiacus TaxID=1936993 RepID=A0A401ZQA7_9CHLR|nr:acetylornithine deacetylase [Dictyobacter aurantiacus]GCE09057.1 acetylornithine deacetylase [Dictyobacter aurantiacus]
MSTHDIQSSELWEVSRRLINFDTVSAHSNLEAVEYLEDYLKEIGFTVKVIADDVDGVKKASVLAWFGPSQPGGLMISGHIDVVPFEGQPGWKTDPLVMETDGKRIYGRGTADMKIFIAQALVAAKQVVQQHQDFKRPLLFVFTYDEEVAGQGSGRLIKMLPQFFEETFPMPEMALIGEPTDFEIYSAHKGYATFDLVVRGIGGHSSVPKKGMNAIEKMGDVIRIITEIDRELEQRITPENTQLFPECPPSAFNFGIIGGGLAANMIADTCRLKMSLRVSPGDTSEEILGTMKDRIEREVTRKMREFSPECAVTIENLHATPPMKSPQQSPLSALLSRVFNKPVEHGAPYGTDAGNFQHIGINSYVCGPGALEQAHQPNESIPVEHFLSGQEKVEQIIADWCVQD